MHHDLHILIIGKVSMTMRFEPLRGVVWLGLLWYIYATIVFYYDMTSFSANLLWIEVLDGVV